MIEWRSADRLCGNGIPDPVGFVALDCDHVEPACRRHPITLQVMLGRDNQFSLLGWRHTGSRTAMTASLAQTDFDENQHVTFAHDQIDFAALAEKIALDKHQSLTLQIGERRIFAALSGFLFGRAGTKKAGKCHSLRAIDDAPVTACR